MPYIVSNSVGQKGVCYWNSLPLHTKRAMRGMIPRKNTTQVITKRPICAWALHGRSICQKIYLVQSLSFPRPRIPTFTCSTPRLVWKGTNEPCVTKERMNQSRLHGVGVFLREHVPYKELSWAKFLQCLAPDVGQEMHLWPCSLQNQTDK